MAVDATHGEYDANAGAWSRARDVIAGEDAVRAGRERYLPRLDSQADDEYAAYAGRASFFNATARTADCFVGLIFRRAPLVRLPDEAQGVGAALAAFRNDVDMLGTSLFGYAKNIVSEIIAVGRAGTLVDWEGEVEDRVYATMYRAESILNWRVERINGRNIPTLVVLHEPMEAAGGGTSPQGGSTSPQPSPQGGEGDAVEQIRVLRLVAGADAGASKRKPYSCQVELWRKAEAKSGQDKREWVLVETRIPLRRGKPLPSLPFVFHGPRHSRPAVDKLPLGDMIAVNLDHYRLDADYKHGIHFTALPTAWVSGFDKTATLRIGSSTAWTTETVGATAGFLEFTGQGLSTFERAMDRDERLMAVLGSRLLEEQKRVGETADAIELRQSGENSVLSSIASSVSESLTQVLRWAFWWNSTEELPDSITDAQALVELNTDFSSSTMSAPEMLAAVKSWQSGALSQDSMQELFRKGEILPDGRTNEEEARLIAGDKAAVKVAALTDANANAAT
ncbi:MAG: DUF4055 domain-containing protein [Verrucomicrobiota bacterium]|jgi:hypothetical protein